MSRLSEALGKGQPVLVPFVTIGDPSLAITADIVVEMGRRGAGVVELGIPYSDPIADGPTIAAASHRALARGVRLDDVFDTVAAIRERSDVPLVLFTYCNPVFRFGPENFMKRAAEVGAEGVLMPDLPPEEAGEILASASKYGIDTVFLVAPTTSTQRLETIARATRGFLYLVAALGVTGARSELAEGLKYKIALAKAAARLPIAVGFGLSSPDQAHQVAGWGADGIVIGSALVDQLHQWRAEPDIAMRAGNWVANFVAELGGARV